MKTRHILYAIAALILLSVLSGCSVLQAVATKGADANDTLIKTSIFAICEGGSVGSIRREFDTPEEAILWTKLCSRKNGGFTPSPIEE